MSPFERPLAAFTTSDGLRLRYAVDDFTPAWKPPETVVLLHAAMGSMNRFRGWMPALVPHYRVVRWDMRGHGASDQPPEGSDLSIERLAQDLVELLNHLQLDRAHVVGSSTGGIIGLHAAIHRPDRLHSLASYAAIPGLSPSTSHNDYTAWTQGLEREGVRGFLRRTVRQRFDPDRTDPGLIDWFIEESARNDPRFLARFVSMMTGTNFGDRLQEIRCPCLFVVPSGDPVHSIENYNTLRAVPDHRFIVYENMAHNITDAVPERCVGDLLPFLAAQTSHRAG
jgi:pimeloyl-ACP methyl ester carboxylesterase